MTARNRIFEDLTKQNDTSTRLKTARMMDCLSGGVCIRNWLRPIKMEFARHVYRTLRGGHTNEATFPIWTKAGYCAGEHTVTFPHLPGHEHHRTFRANQKQRRWQAADVAHEVVGKVLRLRQKILQIWPGRKGTRRGKVQDSPLFITPEMRNHHRRYETIPRLSEIHQRSSGIRQFVCQCRSLN